MFPETAAKANTPLTQQNLVVGGGVDLAVGGVGLVVGGGVAPTPQTRNK